MRRLKYFLDLKWKRVNNNRIIHKQLLNEEIQFIYYYLFIKKYYLYAIKRLIKVFLVNEVDWAN